MKIVIDVNESYYKWLKELPESYSSVIEKAIIESTPIEDGDLISRKSLKKEISRLVVGGENAIKDAGIGNFWINGLHSAVRCIDNMKSVGEEYE